MRADILSITRWTSSGPRREDIAYKQHHRLEIILDGFSLAIPGNTLVANYSNPRVLPDDRTLKVGDLDGDMPRRPFRERHTAALSSRERGCGRDCRKRSDKSSSRQIGHWFLKGILVRPTIPHERQIL